MWRKVCNKIRSIEWLRRIHQAVWRWKIRWFVWLPHSALARFRYVHRLAEVRTVAKNRPIRILFPISGSLAKWKMQRLYDLFRTSNKYEPLMALTSCDIYSAGTNDENTELDKTRRYLAQHDMKYVEAYDWNQRVALSFKPFKPDIVWYQNPWQISPIQMPYAVSKYALTCYVPYFVQNYGGLDMDCGTLFHRELWRHFTLNQAWADAFMKYQGRIMRAGDVIGCGHPMLDRFCAADGKIEHKAYVIYAPHWSCGVGECYSTFLENGKLILEVAKKNRQFSWVFKPHPTLRYILRQENLMDDREIDAYYAEWAHLGVVCEDGDYVDIFKKSRAMITDCASFLVEYACTKSPIIHLVSSQSKYRPHPISEALFKSYYQVRDWNEFEKVFKRVVVDGDDFKKAQRLSKIKELKLGEVDASRQILDYLEETLNIKKDK